MTPYTAQLGHFLLVPCFWLSLCGSFPSGASVCTSSAPTEPALRTSQLASRQTLPVDSTEAHTLRQGVARRLPTESAEAFLQRVLPASFRRTDAQPIIQYAWRPSPFGKQLFFSAPGSPEFYRLYVFVLDPYQADTYAVERFEVPQLGAQVTSPAALFFADANHDGRKELLVLADSPSCEPIVVKGETGNNCTAHYFTSSYGYVPAAEGQRPHYKTYRRRPDLDDLETAAQVRQVLAFQSRQHARKALRIN